MIWKGAVAFYLEAPAGLFAISPMKPVKQPSTPKKDKK